MSDINQVSVCLPFAGFYGSNYSYELDREEEQFCEYEAEESDEGEKSQAAELRLTASELADILYRVTDYQAAHLTIAEWYVSGFESVASEYLGFDLGLTFETMTSPREYNFQTDRIFAFMPLASVEKLFALSAKDKHKAFAAAIKARFTSYDGFLSGYDNRLESWLEKPLDEWDHNEVSTLLIAAMELNGADSDELDSELYAATLGDEGGYTAWSQSVDWPRYERDLADARADKLDELRDEDPERWNELSGADALAFPLRCPETLDLFRAAHP